MTVSGTALHSSLRVEKDLLVAQCQVMVEQGADDSATWAGERDLVARMDLETADPLSAERQLDDAATHFRSLLLRRGQQVDERFYRSPDSMINRHLPSGQLLQHGYERSLPVVDLERRLATRCADLPPGWTRSTVALNSGMAALSHVLMGLIHMLGPTEARPLGVSFWGDYFETDLLLSYLSSSIFRPRKLSPTALESAWTDPRAGEVMLIEPVRYNWSLDTLDLQRFVQGWRHAVSRPSIIVVDSTLSSPVWPTRRLLEALTVGSGAPLVVEVRSALKLDQQGMELANLGVVDVFSHDTRARGVPSAAELAVTLRLARGTHGSGPSVSDAAVLDAPFLLDEEWTRLHSGQVYLNNARVAETLAGVRGVFADVVHPSLRGGTGVSRHNPFVVVHLADNTLANHGLLLAAIRHECAHRRLTVVHGSSFGFRSTRYETIVPQISVGEGLFKVAAGARSGPSLDGLTNVLARLGALPDIAALTDRYPHLTPVPLS